MSRWRIRFTLPEIDGKSWREALAERPGRPLDERRTLAGSVDWDKHPVALFLWLIACECQDRRIRSVTGLLLTMSFLIHLLWSLLIRWL